jgi:hypothetical protein
MAPRHLGVVVETQRPGTTVAPDRDVIVQKNEAPGASTGHHPQGEGGNRWHFDCLANRGPVRQLRTIHPGDIEGSRGAG